MYTKEPLSYEKQADQLLDRGLIANRQILIDRLKSVNYYRLSGYLHPFRLRDYKTALLLDHYREGTALEVVWNRYRFDRQLRLLVLDAIERFEVSLKTNLSYEFSHSYGPFGYLNPAHLPKMKSTDFGGFLKKLADETSRSEETFVKHFDEKYGKDHPFLPIWMAVEIMSFGSTLTLFRGLNKDLQNRIVKPYGLVLDVLLSWFQTLNAVRNICAHHGRLWNRVMGVKPILPTNRTKYPQWFSPSPIPQDKIFGILTILKYLIDKIAPQSQWPQRLKTLLAENPEIPLNFMGFPDNWEEHGVWV
jgi:abortive infection bacteriophage resistance protein